MINEKVTPVLCMISSADVLILTVHADGNQPYELYLKRVDNNTGLMVMGFVKGTTPDSKYELVIPAEADYYYDDNMQKCELSKPRCP